MGTCDSEVTTLDAKGQGGRHAEDLSKGFVRLETPDGEAVVTEVGRLLGGPVAGRPAFLLKPAAGEAFSPLLGTLKSNEELKLSVVVTGAADPASVRVSVAAEGRSEDEAAGRRDALEKALDAALSAAFPIMGFRKFDKGPTPEYAFETTIRPEGYRLPLAVADLRQVRAELRAVPTTDTGDSGFDELILPSLPHGIGGLDTVMRLLDSVDGAATLTLTIRRRTLSASELRQLYVARARLRGNAVAKVVDDAKLPAEEFGGSDYLSALIQDRSGFQVWAEIASDEPIDETLAAVVSYALFGTGVENGPAISALDLRMLYPRATFQKALLPVILALAPEAAFLEARHNMFPKDGVLLGRMHDDTEIRLSDADRAAISI